MALSSRIVGVVPIEPSAGDPPTVSFYDKASAHSSQCLYRSSKPYLMTELLTKETGSSKISKFSTFE